MPFKISKSRKTLLVLLILCFTLLSGISIGYFSNHVFSENARFENFTEELFEKEVSGSALTFHYSVAHPEKAGLKRPKPTLGTVNTNMEKTYALCREYEDTLRSFSYSKLSRENQITLDMLLLYFHTQASLEIIIFWKKCSLPASVFRHSSLSFLQNMPFMKTGTYRTI